MVDAVRCAIEAQNGIIVRNIGVPSERVLENTYVSGPDKIPCRPYDRICAPPSFLQIGPAARAI